MICAIVLAAGFSRRMGTQKLLLPLAGKPVIAHVVDAVLCSQADQVFVVTGVDGERIANALSEGRRWSAARASSPASAGRVSLPARAVNFIGNPHPELGMLGSIRCGLSAMPAGCAAALVVLGDQPTISAGVINRLIQSFREDGYGIVVPVWEGRRGHPLLLSTRYRDEMLARYDDVGLRALLSAHPSDICEVPMNDAGILEDLDQPHDYQRLVARFSRSEGPGTETEKRMVKRWRGKTIFI